MRIWIFVIMCIHLLLWAGCDSKQSPRRLGSDQIGELEKLTYMRDLKPTAGFWRKLLEENAFTPDNITKEEIKVPVQIEDKGQDGKAAQIVEVGEEVKVEPAATTAQKEEVQVDEPGAATAQKEEVKVEPAATTAHKEEVKVEPAVATAQKEEVKVEPAVATAQKEEVKVEPVVVATAQQEDIQKDQPKSEVRTSEVEPAVATAQKEEVKVEPVVVATAQQEDIQKDQPKSEVRASEETDIVEEVKKMETQEAHGQATAGATPVQSQDLLKDQNNTPGTDEAATKLMESVDEGATVTVEEAAATHLEDGIRTEEHEQQKTLPHADAMQVQKEEENQIKAEVDGETPVDIEEKKDISGAEAQTEKPEDVKEQNLMVAAREDEKQDGVQEQKTDALAEVTTLGDEKQAELKEEDLIKMVESGVAESDDGQKNTELDLDAIMKRVDLDSNGNPGSTDDSKVDNNKTELNNESSNNMNKEEQSMESKDKETDDNDKDEIPEVKTDEEAQAATNEVVSKLEELRRGSVESKEKETEDNDKDEIPEVKTDEDTQAATNEVVSKLEELRRGSVFDLTNDRRQERDPSDDDYDIMQELADLPTKFQETAGKVADHLRPDVLKWTDTSKVYFNLANQQITESFSPIIGKQYAPFIAAMISYGILLLPLIVVIMLFEHIRALLSLQKILLFINIYLTAYFATLWLASYIIGLEPMSFFYHNSLSSYLSLQLLQALGYVVYLILQTANIINSCTSDTFIGKLTAVLQWMAAVSIGLHYYVTVFHPAVASKPPHANWKIYAIYSVAFFILCLFARIRWVKKQYISSGNDITNKKS